MQTEPSVKEFLALQHKYTFVKSYPTNISEDYLNDSGSKWGTWEMLRESIQNMMDEAEYMSDNHGGAILDHCLVQYWPSYGNYLDLRDKGRGVDWAKIFLIGVSGKRGTHYKGQKGEGESLSFLVAARAGICKTMFSQDWAVRARLDQYDNSPYKVLVFDLYKTNKPIEGTVWRFDAHPEIVRLYRAIGDYFPQLSKQAQRENEQAEYRTQVRQAKADKAQKEAIKREIKKHSTSSTRMIITPKSGQPSRLYVRGVYVKDIYSLFSYNLANVEINRDRSMVDDMQILEQIGKAFDSKDFQPSQAEAYWRNAEDGAARASRLEYRDSLNIYNNSEIMVKAFYKVYGKNACLSTTPAAEIDATTLGFKVVKLVTNAANTAKNLDIRTDVRAAGYEGEALPMKALSNTQKALIAKLQEIGKAFGFKDYTIVPTLKILGVDDKSTMGLYKGGTIYILKWVLEGPRAALLETYIHEAGHGESGALDATRAFTDWFEKFNVQSLIGAHDHVRPLINELFAI